MELLLSLLLTLITLLLLFVIVVAFFYILDLFFELPYVTTDKRKIDTILELADIQKGETVVDLGSGDGRLLFVSAERGALPIGYEINPALIMLTMLRAKLKGLEKQVTIKNISFWKADLKVADVIFVYAFRKTMTRFEDFIWQNAKKGTRVVVNTNPFPNKKPQKEKDNIFLYVV